MKRALCLLLVFALLMCVYVIGASATTTINDTLRAEMDKAGEDDLIRVNLWVFSKHMTEEEIDRQARTEVGLPMWLSINQMTNEECDKYIIARRRIETQLEEDACLEFIEKYGLTDEMVNYHIATLINCNLTKEQIELFATCSEVDDMFFDDLREVPTEAPTQKSTERPVSSTNAETRFKEHVAQRYGTNYTGYTYNEIYYHYNKNREIDWILFEGYISGLGDMFGHQFVANRLISQRNSYRPFFGTMGVYIVENNKVTDVTGAKYYDLDDFDEIYDAFGYGVLMGDLDGDNEISIADVTQLQRCLADFRSFPDTDSISTLNEGQLNGVKYYSDFNRDGDRDIMDVTFIQRYLAGMDYPIG